MSGRPLDPDSLCYARHWEPVLAPPARRALDRIAPTPGTFLDLGAGTGSLTLDAAHRWPAARIIALDASSGMLAVARARVHDEGHDHDRFRWLPADAADIPLDDASVDAVASSFMLQLPEDRPTVLAEVRRVLRPGGRFAFVTWLAEELELRADDHFMDALDAIGIEDAIDEEGIRHPRPCDFRSPEQARVELVDAGFGAVEVGLDELRYAWTPDMYLAYKEEYDEQELFDSLDPSARERLRADLRHRLARLEPADLELRGPLVTAVAQRPPDGPRLG